MLSDCVRKDSSICELFIVEEGAAAITAKHMRDRLTHAVLPITPMMPKIGGATIYDLLDDEQIKSIIASLGIGIAFRKGKVESEEFSLSQLRYGKIIIVTEATPEGKHIRTQVVSFFFRFNYPLLAAGHVYIVPSDRWVGMNEEEFESKVMAPVTRRLVQIQPGTTLPETLAFLDAADSARG